MKEKHWYFLTMLPLVALLNYATNSTWWQAVLLGALLNMWAWTLLSPHLATDGKKDGGIEAGQPARQRDPGRDVRQWANGITADEDMGFSPAAFDGNSSAIQANPANGLPMLNSVYDVHGNVFGTTWADDQGNHGSDGTTC